MFFQEVAKRICDLRHALHVIWFLVFAGVGVIALGGLAAMGALGSISEEDELASSARIPTALFGYRRDVVDRMLAELREAAGRD